MSGSTQSESTHVSLVQVGARPGNANRLQFSISALMLATLIVAIFCAAIPWFGSVWVVPCGLAGLSAANLVLAVRRRSSWRMLKVGHLHLAMWLAFAAAATGFAVRGCLDYNDVAGTDKTPRHIVQISAAVLAGPMVGPVANSGAGETPQAWTMTAILFTILLAATSPFLFVRRMVPVAVAVFCWTGFVAATILWFFGAMISLAVFLS